MQTSERIEAGVTSQLNALGVEHEMFEIDPDFADTAAFCEKYGYPPENSGNTIVVASKRGQKKHCACIVLATDRLDVNRRVKGLMGVSRASFAGADETMDLTGMMIGGVTPFGLPQDLPIYADAKIRALDYVILGGGSRSTKLKVAPRGARQAAEPRIHRRPIPAASLTHPHRPVLTQRRREFR